jgi:ribulose-phosphate 3-epimerase
MKALTGGAQGISSGNYALDKILNTLELIKSFNIKVGVSINPATPVSALEGILGQVDLVLLMSVNPGFGGQKFKPIVLEKIAQLKNLACKKNRAIGLNLNAGELAIEIDGGVNVGPIADNLKKAGANVLVAGSAIYGSADIAKTIESLKIL